MREVSEDVTPDKILKVALGAKNRLDEHISDSSWLDCSLDEHLLASKDPELYDLRVNGIRHIHVRDGSVDIRYEWRDGKLVNVAPGVF